ncbi:PD-(D/E)XK nuclease family protein [Kribbella sp. NBC_01245]|uniref:PD-(D/E)XK nuclease family protein n=1 Tax=Kribbella sp. NBC_01245 TaxID=2903578 RepID=UPI002E2B3B94|nr:PD-(D/E)XK nuclease family protein [Kribbella sp. NBC_01245]
MGIQVETTPYGAAALSRLRDVVAGVKRDDPMTPVTLLLPSNTAGLIARRQLAADLGSVAGLYLATLPRLAEQLAAAGLAPRRPATRPIVAATWRAILSKDPGVFAAVADHPATIQALASAHQELRDLSDDALTAVGQASGLGPDLVRLHRQVTSTLHTEWYDVTALLRAAADRARREPAVVAELGALVLYLPQELTQAEAGFVEALTGSADLTVIVGLTDVRRADRTVRRSLERIGLAPPESATRNRPVATEVLNASDADDEVRCVVRDVVATLADTPAHRIAVLYSAPAPYARLLHEQLAAARIEVNGPGTRPVHERAVARTLLEVLALVDHDLPRAEVFRALANAPSRDFEGNRIPVPQWERLSRAAGVIRGEDWAERLGRFAEAERRVATQELEAEDPRPAAVEMASRNAETARRLHVFAVELRRRLLETAGLTSWSELANGVLDLFHALLDLTSLPVEEQYAAIAVEASLRGLSTLDELGTPASLSVLRDVLDLELQQSLPRVGTFGTGVLVAPISASIGLAVDTVYVLGLAEDLYPGRIHEDALLPQRVRDAAAPELASARDRLDEKHRQLLAAFASGSSRVVASFPRGDLRRSSRRLPTRWLLGTLRELSGDRRLAATAWDQPSYGGKLITSASFAGSLVSAALPSTEQEWRIRGIGAGFDLPDQVVDRARSLLKARNSEHFTRYDGNLAGVAGLPSFATEDRVASPTSLESYASCPHAYFVERLLQVEPIEQPEDLLVISPMQIGNLIHDSIDAFVTTVGPALPRDGEPWTHEQRALLLSIGSQLADRFEAEGLTGHPRLWQREKLRIFADLLFLLADDDRWRAVRRASVVASELRFGFDGEPPVEIVVPSGRVRFRGSADKVDLGADGTIYVTDVKTGGPSRFEAIATDPVAAGTKLQLPVYAYAARARLGDEHTPVESAYWFVRRGGVRIPVPLTPEVEARYVDTLDTIVSSIAAGWFPAKAPEVPDFLWVQCPYCNPDSIGHAEVRGRWERKRFDPALQRLVRLIDPGVLDD